MGASYSYDILVNPVYSNKFNYIPTYQKGRLSFVAAPDCNEDFTRSHTKKNEARKTEHLYNHESK